jgi:hypothetical protein
MGVKTGGQSCAEIGYEILNWHTCYIVSCFEALHGRICNDVILNSTQEEQTDEQLSVLDLHITLHPTIVEKNIIHSKIFFESRITFDIQVIPSQKNDEHL